MNDSIKTIRFVVLGLFLILITTSTLQAQQSVAQQLLGTWELDEPASFSSISPVFQARLDTIPQLQAQLVNSYRGRTTYFGNDGTYRVTLSDGRSITGNWELTTAAELKLTASNGDISYQTIASLQASTLVLIPVVSGNTTSIVSQLHYVKR